MAKAIAEAIAADDSGPRKRAHRGDRHAREPMGTDLGALGNGRGRGSEQARRERRSGRIGLPAD